MSDQTTSTDTWFALPTGGVLYGDGSGGATIVGVTDHWPHGPDRNEALAALAEVVRERDRLRAALSAHDQQDPDECSLCHVPKSTGTCNHLIELGRGRVGMKRSVWEGLVEDRLRLREIESSSPDVITPAPLPAEAYPLLERLTHTVTEVAVALAELTAPTGDAT